MMFYNCVRQLIYSFFIAVFIIFQCNGVFIKCVCVVFYVFYNFILLNLNALVMAILYSNIRTVTKKGGAITGSYG